MQDVLRQKALAFVQFCSSSYLTVINYYKKQFSLLSQYYSYTYYYFEFIQRND